MFVSALSHSRFYSVNVLFSATPHLLAVYQQVMWITQKNDFPSLTYILI